MPADALICAAQAGNVQAAVQLIRQHQRNFMLPGACSEAERDRIEAVCRGLQPLLVYVYMLLF